MNYECHITVDTKYAVQAQAIAKDLHWKTSEIARDPVLGDKNFFYLTTHTGDIKTMFQRLDSCKELLVNREIPIIREKIELIIHDTKTNRFLHTDDIIESDEEDASIVSVIFEK